MSVLYNINNILSETKDLTLYNIPIFREIGVIIMFYMITPVKFFIDIYTKKLCTRFSLYLGTIQLHL